jgi:hypothetical protein
VMVLAFEQVRVGALEDDLAAGGAGAGADVDDVVGGFDDVGVVLHDEHGVALVAEFGQQVVEAVDVAGVQADAGLVEDVHDVDQGAVEVLHELDALRLAAGQGVGGAVEGEVAEADFDQVGEALLDGFDEGVALAGVELA